MGKRRGERKGREEGERGRGERKGREEGERGRGERKVDRGRGERKGKGVAHSFKQVKEEKRQNEGNGRETWRGEEGTLHKLSLVSRLHCLQQLLWPGGVCSTAVTSPICTARHSDSSC